MTSPPRRRPRHTLLPICIVAIGSSVLSSTAIAAETAPAATPVEPPPIREVVIEDLAEPGEIVVSLEDRMLYRVTERGRAYAYPIAVPRPDSIWRGRERITDKRVWPAWRPTEAMKAEMPYLPDVIPGGAAENPMGARALYLGETAYRIHGTDAPGTIGAPVSAGCIRMFNGHVVDLYEHVEIGAWVRVTFHSLKPDAPG